MDPTALAEAVVATARGAGADVVGVATADPFPEVEAALVEAVGEGRSGPVRQTYADPTTAADPRVSFPWAERIVVLGRAYVPRAGAGRPGPGIGHVARFATTDHYLPVRAAGAAVATVLEAEGARAELVVDDPRLVDRAVAVRAGIGWWGKNTMVLAPRYGPWLLIGSVVTDVPLPVSVPQQRSCGTCAACLPACPTGALVAPGVLDARRCLATWLQAPGDIPLELREPMGARIYGCDDCLDACPPGMRLGVAPSTERGEEDIVALLALDDDALVARFAHWYIPRRQGRYLRRNLTVALANTGTPDHLPLMVELAHHPSALVRRHAVWGVARLSARWGLRAEGRAALHRCATEERVADVRTAIADATRLVEGGSDAYPAPS